MKLSEIVTRLEEAPKDFGYDIELKDGRVLDAVGEEVATVRRETGRKFAGVRVTLSEAALNEPDIPARSAEMHVTRGPDDTWVVAYLTVWEGSTQHTIGEIHAIRPDPK